MATKTKGVGQTQWIQTIIQKNLPEKRLWHATSAEVRFLLSIDHGGDNILTSYQAGNFDAMALNLRVTTVQCANSSVNMSQRREDEVQEKRRKEAVPGKVVRTFQARAL